jgi:hypothetical protein
MTRSARKAAVLSPRWLAPCSKTSITTRVKKYVIPSVAIEPRA